jgi:hypothetical protein
VDDDRLRRILDRLAADRAENWQHDLEVMALTDEDRQRLAALAVSRATSLGDRRHIDRTPTRGGRTAVA